VTRVERKFPKRANTFIFYKSSLSEFLSHWIWWSFSRHKSNVRGQVGQSL